VLLPVLRALAAHGTLRAAGAAAGAQAPELRSGLPAVRDLLRRGYLVAG